METKNSESQPLVIKTDPQTIVDHVCFSPDGKLIVSSGRVDTPQIWDAQTGLRVGVLRGHKKPGVVYSTNFSPDGKQLASGGSDEAVLIWDVATMEFTRVFDWLCGPVWDARFSPDGKKLAICTMWRLGMLDLADVDRPIKWNVKQPGSRICFTPDGKLLVNTSDDGRLCIWDVETGALVKAIPTDHGRITDIDVSPDGKLVAASASGNFTRYWDIETGFCWHMCSSHSSPGTSVRFSPDGKLLASSNYECVRLWGIETGRCVSVLSGHTEYITSVCFSSDGKRIASGSADSTIRVWDVAAEIKRQQEAASEARKRKTDETAETQEKKPKEETTVSEKPTDKSE